MLFTLLFLVLYFYATKSAFYHPPEVKGLILVCLCGWVHIVYEVICIHVCTPVYRDQRTLSGTTLVRSIFYLTQCFSQVQNFTKKARIPGQGAPGVYPSLPSSTILGSKRTNHHIQLSHGFQGSKSQVHMPIRQAVYPLSYLSNPRWTDHNLSSTLNYL